MFRKSLAPVGLSRHVEAIFMSFRDVQIRLVPWRIFTNSLRVWRVITCNLNMIKHDY